MKIYTKTGDKGDTSLYGGTRVSKGCAIIDAIGNIDELNASLGVITNLTKDKFFSQELFLLNRIQAQLFIFGADLATPKDINKKLKQVRIKSSDYTYVEKQIDKYDSFLPQMTTFILPSGSDIGTKLHLSRAICRRAERSVVYASSEVTINPKCLIYINRLSDLLFVLARYFNHKLNIPEIPWLS